MLTHVDAIIWLLFESDIKTTKIAKACKTNTQTIENLRNRNKDLQEITLKQAIALSDYAQAIKEAEFHAKRRWVVYEENKLKIYKYEDLNSLSDTAQLINEITATQEVEAFEKIKTIYSHTAPDEAQRFILQRFKQAERDAFRSIGFQ